MYLKVEALAYTQAVWTEFELDSISTNNISLDIPVV